MGLNQQSQQPQPYNSSPESQAQLDRIKGLQSAALTPYSGNARGGGAAQGAAQLAAALMAKQAQQQWQQKFGVPTYGNPAAQPGAVSPGVGVGGFATPPGQPLPQTMNAQPVPAAGAANG